MAVIVGNFVLDRASGLSRGISGTPCIHRYGHPTDTISQIQSDGYFNDVYGSSTSQTNQEPTLRVGDLVFIKGSDAECLSRINATSPNVTTSLFSYMVNGSGTIGNFANFYNENGVIEDLGFSPTDATKTKVVMKVGTPTSGNIASFDSNGSVQDAGVAANRALYSSITTPDTNANLVYFTSTLTFSQLASGAINVLYPSSGTNRYVVIDIRLNGQILGALSGGNRNLYIGDAIGFEWTVIPTAALTSPTNSRLGSTNVPASTTIGYSTPTSPGSNIIAQTTGGTTDYTGGSVTISVLMARVA